MNFVFPGTLILAFLIVDKLIRNKPSNPYITQQICQNVGEIAKLASKVREVVRSFCSE